MAAEARGKHRLHSGRQALQSFLRVLFESDDALCAHVRHDEGARR